MRERETCEICGRGGVFGIVQVEGAKLRACKNCAYGKKVLYYLDEEPAAKSNSFMATVKPRQEETEEIVDNYGKIIRDARDKLGLTTMVVAERINEKHGYLERVERGELAPTLALAKKLEKELNIKLIEKVTSSITPTLSKQKFSEPTLGDLVDEGEK